MWFNEKGEGFKSFNGFKAFEADAPAPCAMHPALIPWAGGLRKADRDKADLTQTSSAGPPHRSPGCPRSP